MKSPQERQSGQIPIFSKEELDAAANPQKEKPAVKEEKSNTLSPEEIENLYRDDDEDRKKYWNR